MLISARRLSSSDAMLPALISTVALISLSHTTKVLASYNLTFDHVNDHQYPATFNAHWYPPLQDENVTFTMCTSGNDKHEYEDTYTILGDKLSCRVEQYKPYSEETTWPIHVYQYQMGGVYKLVAVHGDLSNFSLTDSDVASSNDFSIAATTASTTETTTASSTATSKIQTPTCGFDCMSPAFNESKCGNFPCLCKSEVLVNFIAGPCMQRDCDMKDQLVMQNFLKQRCADVADPIVSFATTTLPTSSSSTTSSSSQVTLASPTYLLTTAIGLVISSSSSRSGMVATESSSADTSSKTPLNSSISSTLMPVLSSTTSFTSSTPTSDEMRTIHVTTSGIIGISVGGTIGALVLLGCLVFCCRISLHKHSHAAADQTATEQKEIPLFSPPPLYRENDSRPRSPVSPVQERSRMSPTNELPYTPLHELSNTTTPRIRAELGVSQW